MAQVLAGNFIGREQHLARLHEHLEQALRGTGQVCFVTGEPGAGKTALVAEFTRTAQHANKDVIVAFGDCNSLSGEGDAYLPFREIMTLLLGDVDQSVAEGTITQENAGRLRRFFNLTRDAIIESGPDIVGIFVPGGSLLTRLGTKLMYDNRAAPRAGIDQAQLLYQFTNVLRRLAEQQPLVLVIDDLHWADAASINLLFHLARRIEGSPILLLGTFRPHEIAEGRSGARHPLEPVVNELRRYYGDVEIDLDTTGDSERRAFVEKLLDAEPNNYAPEFRNQFYRHTDGHALFSIELLNALKQRGVVRRDGAVWTTQQSVDWKELPHRVEGVIAERLHHLPRALYELLGWASVEGEQFTAEVLARVLNTTPLEVVQQLGEVQKKHRLVRPYGSRREGNVQLSGFRFAHSLFQTFLYREMTDVERAYRHAALGEAIEAVYGNDAAAAAVVLGNHFAAADNPQKATLYLRLAGDGACCTYGYREAVELYARALEFAHRLGDRGSIAELHELTGDVEQLNGHGVEAIAAFEESSRLADTAFARARLRRKIAHAHGDAHRITQAETAFGEANTMLNAVADRDQAWWHEWLQLRLNMAWVYYFHRPDALLELIAESRDAMEQYGTRAQQASFKQLFVLMGLRADRYRLTSATMAAAKEFLDAGRASGDRYLECMATFQYGFCLIWSGRHEEAEPFLEESLHLAERIGAAFPKILALTYLAVLARMRNQVDATESWLRRADAAAREANNFTYVACALANQGWVALQRGDRAAAEPLLLEALELWAANTVAYPLQWLALAPLAVLRMERGDTSGAADALTRMVAADQQLLAEPVMRAIERQADEALSLLRQHALY